MTEVVDETALWTSRELGRVLGSDVRAQWDCQGISIDSRTLKRGDLFFALSGPHFDGHDYVAEVFEKGAAGAVVSKPVAGADPARLLMVKDVRAALVMLGRAGRDRVEAPVIAVTGSVGKTGVKEALRLALGRDKKTHASILSYNNEIGVPLSLARMPRDAAYGVFELGMNHKGELKELVRLVRPHVAIVTTVELAHSEFFESVEEIADAKAEIFTAMTGPGVALLNRDNDQYGRLRQRAEQVGVNKIVSFGSTPEADIHILEQVLEETQSIVTANVNGKIMTYRIGLAGQHWVLNSLAVLGAVDQVGGDLGLAGLALAEMAPLKGRGQRHRIPLRPEKGTDRGRTTGDEAAFVLIDESYNANPASMRAALASQGQITPASQGRRIAVLGDMAELGSESAALHAALADAVSAAGIERLYLIGTDMRHLGRVLEDKMFVAHFDTIEDLAQALDADLRCDDVVMVKGSNASGMFRLVERMLDMTSPNVKKATNG
ncbi:UDP-N-acetylmuramoyl-tripeptide--D-alanyl-D-alanine ligase [Luteithermobacter gelatinilyticus]|uniref:UDP-N-acetylmuramoyl-tripeptide--D-alanyl-D- alanine ligase n=1 Tax=Luteithermobacter gelatinilyticus TaxID=2582913 RepID=UPI0011074835|nr:UDP-N-acetylmuramoyl-tripeptide--D-alanyl-D-alanine ligase [Luteithermobacter gelatinilyticus]